MAAVGLGLQARGFPGVPAQSGSMSKESSPEVARVRPSPDASGDLSGPAASNRSARTQSRDYALSATLVLASLPSLLVLAERWLGNESINNLLTPLWCRLPHACLGPWPATTLLIVPSILGAVFLVARRPVGRLLPEPHLPPLGPVLSPRETQRGIAKAALIFSGFGMAAVIVWSAASGNRPGWDYVLLYLSLMASVVLHEVPLRRIGAAIFAVVYQGAAPLAAHVLLIAALFAAIIRWSGTPVLLTLAVAGHLVLWRKRHMTLSPAFWLISASLVLGSLYLTAWWFAVIGDEYAFYRYASRILTEADVVSVGGELYNPSGVYSAHPGFSSLIQSASMAVFGRGLFGWRFSNVYLVALSLWPFYSFALAIWGRRLAVLAGALLATSHYLMSFSKIGYNNLQALFAFTVCLAAATWFVRSPSRLAAAGFGAVLGLTFYVFPGALLTLPVALLIPVIQKPTRASPGRWLIVGAALVATAVPFVIQQEFWETKRAGTLWYDPAMPIRWSSTGLVILRNLGLAALSFLRSASESHFVAVGFVDVITAILVVLGVGVLLRPPLNRRAGTLLAGLAILLLLVGALHGYASPPTTRMFLLLPWLAILGALGLRWIQAVLGKRGLSERTVHRVTVVLLGLILVANLIQAYPLSRLRMALLYQWPPALLIREERNLLLPGPNNARLLILELPDSRFRESLVELLHLHGVPFDEASLEGSNALEVTDDALRDPQTIVMIERSVADSVQTMLEVRLTAAGKSACRFRSSIGEVRLVVWTAPAERYRCAEAAYRW